MDERPIGARGRSPEETGRDAAAATPPPTPAAATPAGRSRLGRRLRLVFWGSVFVVLGTSATLAQTQPGQRFVLQKVLNRVRGALAGELTVAGIRSGTLLTGATLTGVTLTAEGGRGFLTADSVQIRYTPAGIVTGRPRSIELWGLDLEISRYPGEESVNVARLLAPRAEREPTSPLRQARATTPPIRIGRVGVRQGRVSVLMPAEEGRTGPTVPSPTGEGELSRIAFDSLDLDVEEIVLRFDDDDFPLRARLASLSTEVALLAEPLVIEEAGGVVAFGEEGLRVTDAAFALPGSLLRGNLALGPFGGVGEAWSLRSTLTVDTTDGPGDLADLAWLDARVPDGAFSGTAHLRSGDGIEVRLERALVELEASTLGATGVLRFDDGMSFEALDLTLSPLALSRLEPWTGRAAPLDGWLSGNVRLSGTLQRVATSGRLTLVPVGYGGAPTTADFSGTLIGGRNAGAERLVAGLDPVSYPLLEAFAPAARLPGEGTLRLELSGRVNDRFVFVANALHRASGLTDSRANVRGSVERTPEGEWSADLEGDMSTFSVGILRRMNPDIELGGELNGSFTALGRLRDLQIRGDFAAAGGTVSLDGVFDMRRPGAFYRFDASADRIALSTISRLFPEPSTWSGGLSIEGRGLRPDSMDAAVTLRASKGRVGGLHIDTVTAYMRASGGIMTVDSLDALVGGLELTGDGRLGLAAPLDGEARLAFATESLAGLRPLFLGDTVVAKDTLSSLERSLLTFQGVDVDALPDTIDVRMRGWARGTARLVGSVDALDIELDAVLRNAAYGPSQVDSARLVMTAHDLPSFDGEWDVALDAFGLVVEGRAFSQAHLDGSMLARRGSAELAVNRRPGEALRALGDFELDSAGGRVALAEAAVVIDSLEYALARPATLTWDSAAVSVDSLEVSRVGEDPMRLTAHGRLDRLGGSDFRARVAGLQLDRIARITDTEGLELGGQADVSFTVGGLASDPVIYSTWSVDEPRFANVTLTRMEGDFEYFSRRADVNLDAWSGADHVFRASGAVPVDLRFGQVDDRISATPMDLTVEADSLSAAVALAYFGTLEDVDGTVSGALRVRGTIDSPEPDGEVQLRDAAWSIDAVGVRHRGVNGTLRVNPDRTLVVDVRTSDGGTSSLTGTIRLDPFSDPTFDLDIDFGGFQVVSRADMEGRISGTLDLTGRYNRPRINGTLTVDQGTLFVDEFARNAGVVDLTDPRLFGADTTFLEAQPILRDLRNPFLQSLSVQVDLSVPRNTWLRSDEMNVEMGGQLAVAYDRLQGDIVLVGELQALRGSYRVLGRTFDVTGGTVAFIGQPGVNPTLDIQANSRVRRLEGEDIVIDASVQGTLTAPRVDISSQETGLAQSDLFSYLIFGRSIAELTTGDAQFVSGAAGSVATAAASGTLTYLSGALTSRLGATLAEGIGLDYLQISQGGDFQLAQLSNQVLQNTQVEIGRYVGRDAFIVLVLRPFRGGDTELNVIGGARVEYALTEDYTVEGFFEDRFLRRGRAGLGGLGLPTDQILGVFIFRELGY